MKHTVRLPRIVKINEVNGYKISLMFNNGCNMIADFEHILKHKLKVTPKSPGYKLLDPKEFKKVKLSNYTLSWDNVTTPVKLKGGKILHLPFEIGADMLFKLSTPDLSREGIKIGEKLKALRMNVHKTQEEIAILSGTSREYISRIENNRSDIELGTLEKIVKAGFDKEVKIQFV